MPDSITMLRKLLRRGTADPLASPQAFVREFEPELKRIARRALRPGVRASPITRQAILEARRSDGLRRSGTNWRRDSLVPIVARRLGRWAWNRHSAGIASPLQETIRGR